jgi:hypothetical protein
MIWITEFRNFLIPSKIKATRQSQHFHVRQRPSRWILSGGSGNCSRNPMRKMRDFRSAVQDLRDRMESNEQKALYQIGRT